MRNYWQIIRGFNQDIRLYLLFNSCMSFAYLGTISVLLNLYLLRLGYTTTFIGPMQAAGMIAWAVLALPSGAIGARLGLKRAIILSTMCLSFSALLLVAAGFLPEPWRGPGLVAAWVLLWGSASLVSVNSLPYSMAVTDDGNRSYVFAVMQTLSALITLIGSLVAGALPGLLARPLGATLDQPLPYQAAMLLGSFFYLMAGLALVKARNVTVTVHENTGGKAASRPIFPFLMLFVIVLLQSSGDGAARTFFNIYLDTDLRVPVAEIGAILGLSQVLLVAGALLLPAFMARMGTMGTMLAANTLVVACIGLMAALPNTSAAALSFMGFTAAGAVSAITRSIFSQEMVVPRWRTTTSAITTVGMAVGWAISAGLGGVLITSYGFRTLFWIGALLALAASLLIVAYDRVSR